MKVKFLKNGPGFGFGYMAGQSADIPAKKAAELIKLKVVAAAEDGAKGSACELPDVIPHRDELEKAGINSLDDLAKYADDYKAIHGIGEAKATDIADFIKSLED